MKALGEARPLWKILRVLGNVLNVEGFDYETSEQVLAEAVSVSTLPEKLSNDSILTAISVQPQGDKLIRVGGVGIYHTDPIVRRATSLQQTSHAATPEAHLNPNTLKVFGLQDGEQVFAKQNGAAELVTVRADMGLAENVVYLPLHPENAALGGLMNSIELTRA